VIVVKSRESVWQYDPDKTGGGVLIIPLLIFIPTKTFFYDYYKRNAPKVAIKKTNEEYQIQAPFLPLLDNKNIDYSLGIEGAPVELIEFTDFECPYCQLLHERLQELQPLIDEGKVKLPLPSLQWLSWYKILSGLLP